MCAAKNHFTKKVGVRACVHVRASCWDLLLQTPRTRRHVHIVGPLATYIRLAADLMILGGTGRLVSRSLVVEEVGGGPLPLGGRRGVSVVFLRLSVVTVVACWLSRGGGGLDEGHSGRCLLTALGGGGSRGGSVGVGLDVGRRDGPRPRGRGADVVDGSLLLRDDVQVVVLLFASGPEIRLDDPLVEVAAVHGRGGFTRGVEGGEGHEDAVGSELGVEGPAVLRALDADLLLEATTLRFRVRLGLVEEVTQQHGRRVVRREAAHRRRRRRRRRYAGRRLPPSALRRRSRSPPSSGRGGVLLALVGPSVLLRPEFGFLDADDIAPEAPLVDLLAVELQDGLRGDVP
mmetsp:Transcript_28321/g.91341  ORF Transcript_28321/g.91341 Transcript_28321/m.91341 type:complete len:345 (+) Transcript_28321:777-1811(+)